MRKKITVNFIYCALVWNKFGTEEVLMTSLLWYAASVFVFFFLFFFFLHIPPLPLLIVTPLLSSRRLPSLVSSLLSSPSPPFCQVVIKGSVGVM